MSEPTDITLLRLLQRSIELAKQPDPVKALREARAQLKRGGQ